MAGPLCTLDARLNNRSEFGYGSTSLIGSMADGTDSPGLVYIPYLKKLLDTTVEPNYNLEMLITTMQALLIEALEPPQNRKRGDDFRAVEFLQVEDPEIQKKQILELIDELKRKL